MDTTLTPKYIEKLLSTSIGIAIVICLLVSQNLYIFAKDLGLGSYTGISPTLNYIKEEQENKEIQYIEYINNKYKGSKVVEIEKGISHVRMIKYYNNRPVRINVVELSTEINDNLNISPAIASKHLASKSKITEIAKREKALVAINGGYFKPQTGVPLGTLMINKKVYTSPIYDRVAIGFFDNNYAMARVKLNTVLETNIGGFKIDNVNQPRMLSTHSIVYTRDWGKTSPPTPKYGIQLVVNKGKLVGITEKSTEIPEKGFVVIGPAKYLEPISRAKKFKLNMKLNPEWEGVNHIIGGGPYLVKDNQIFVDMTAQKLGSIGGRNPRTAIGYTKDNHLILLTADGRENASIGLTLMELANLMKDLGCVNAMNLDGGGSTVMFVNGNIVNKPATSGGIPLSHTLIISNKKT